MEGKRCSGQCPAQFVRGGGKPELYRYFLSIIPKVGAKPKGNACGWACCNNSPNLNRWMLRLRGIIRWVLNWWLAGQHRRCATRYQRPAQRRHRRLFANPDNTVFGSFETIVNDCNEGRRASRFTSEAVLVARRSGGGPTCTSGASGGTAGGGLSENQVYRRLGNGNGSGSEAGV